MARVTVEDCIDKAPTRFALVMAAAQRARQLSAGAEPTLVRDRDKNTVIALREIAEGTVETETLCDDLVRGYRRVSPLEEEGQEEAAVALDQGEEDWEAAATREAEEAAALAAEEGRQAAPPRVSTHRPEPDPKEDDEEDARSA
jgi:DNA-directed RNA polymerase subunit omega